MKKNRYFSFNPSLVLDKISKKQSIKPSTILKTLISCRAFRRLHRIYKFKLKNTFTSKILRVNERLTAKRSINKYIINGLLEALKQEKKRRKRGKRINLFGKEDSGAYCRNIALLMRRLLY